MPRKKTDPIDDILNYATNAPLAGADVVFKLCGTILKNRHAKEDPPSTAPVRRRRRRTPVLTEATAPEPVQPAAAAPAPVAVKPRRQRRMRAGSPPPPSTATPIVPAQETIEDEDGGETYSEA